MYRPTNYLDQKKHHPTTHSLPRASTVSVKWSNPFVHPPAGAGGPPAIRASRTMPEDTTESSSSSSYNNNTIQGAAAPYDIHRSSSGGFFMSRTRSESSDLRAADLMAQYEMADEEEKQDALVRQADFKSNLMPTMASALVSSQKSMILTEAEKAKRRAELEAKQLQAPLLQEDTTPKKKTKAQIRIELAQKARIERMKELEQQNQVDSTTGHSPTLSSSSGEFREGIPLPSSKSVPAPRLQEKAKPKKMTKAEQRIEIARQTRIRLMAERADSELPNEVGVDVVVPSLSSPSSSSSSSSKGAASYIMTEAADAPPSPRSVIQQHDQQQDQHHWRSYSGNHILC